MFSLCSAFVQSVEPTNLTVTPQQLTVAENSTVSFACNVFAVPAVMFTWERDGESPLSGAVDGMTSLPDTYNSMLTLTNVTVQQAMYSCTAENNVTAKTQTARLTVQSERTL